MSSINQENPDSYNTFVQYAGIAVLIAATAITTNSIQKKLAIIALLVYVTSAFFEDRRQKREANAWALAESFYFLLRFLASILIASETVQIILWIGLLLWAVCFVEEVLYFKFEVKETFFSKLLGALSKFAQWIRKMVMEMMGCRITGPVAEVVVHLQDH